MASNVYLCSLGFVIGESAKTLDDGTLQVFRPAQVEFRNDGVHVTMFPASEIYITPQDLKVYFWSEPVAKIYESQVQVLDMTKEKK